MFYTTFLVVIIKDINLLWTKKIKINKNQQNTLKIQDKLKNNNKRFNQTSIQTQIVHTQKVHKD